MTDKKDPPIEEVGFLGGVTVIDIGDVRVARGLSRRPYSKCQHRRLRYDPRERRIWCADCETNIEGYDAFVIIAEQSHEFIAQCNRRAEQLAEAERFQARSLAVKELDRIWRSRNQVPICPHCRNGLLPEDMKSLRSVGVEYERARRGRAKGEPQ